MTARSSATGWPTLERISTNGNTAFTIPTKRINDGNDLNFFHSSIAYRDLLAWLSQLNRSMFAIKDATGKVSESKLDSPPPYSPVVQSLRALLENLGDLIQKAPPDTGPRRFGNVAFRSWFKLAEENAPALLDTHLGTVLHQLGRGSGGEGTVRNEIQVYLLGSFGSAQRLDYGTGHELSFLAFLACLWKLAAFENGEERAIVIGVVQPYLELVRSLVLTYTLEPAGSHGVWGLDDHSFVPYIFGSAQLGPAIGPSSMMLTPTEGSLPEAPAPNVITQKPLVADYKKSNMYFSAIQFIYDVKKGPFWEHSPVLFDVSGIKDGWGKINKGMLKMYVAEVLGKFPVVQHFPFGSLFPWETDPSATKVHASIHAQQQPRSRDVPPPPAGAGTRAPWATQTTSAVGATYSPLPGPGMAPPTMVPGVATSRPPAPMPRGGVMGPPTAAPWAARREGHR